MYVGRKIRALRTQRGLTLRQLAEVTGLTVPYLSYLELGRRRPQERVLVALCKAMGTEEYTSGLLVLRDIEDMLGRDAGHCPEYTAFLLALEAKLYGSQDPTAFLKKLRTIIEETP